MATNHPETDCMETEQQTNSTGSCGSESTAESECSNAFFTGIDCLTTGSVCQGALETETVPEGCPPPLSWKTVLKKVHDESDSWTVHGKSGLISARAFGTGPSIYFLSGANGTWELFALTMWLLRDDFRCIVIDYPGHQKRFSCDQFVDDFFRIADQNNDQQFALFATGIGAVPAFTALQTEPERITAAIIHAAIIDRKLSLTERFLLQLGQFLPVSFAKIPLVQRIQELNHRTWFPPFDNSRWQFFLDQFNNVPVNQFTRRFAAFRKLSQPKTLETITQPIQFIGSEGEDKPLKQTREQLQSTLPQTTVEILPNCGVLPFLTHPHALSTAIRSVLSPPEPSEELAEEK